MQTIFEVLFYALTLWFVVYEISQYVDAKPNHAFIKKMKAIPDTDERWKDKKWRAVSLMNTAYFLWLLVGLTSFQWPVFLAVILLSFIPKHFVFIRKVDALLSALLLLFVIVNKYQLHLDTWAWIRSLFI